MFGGYYFMLLNCNTLSKQLLDVRVNLINNQYLTLLKTVNFKNYFNAERKGLGNFWKEHCANCQTNSSDSSKSP